MIQDIVLSSQLHFFDTFRLGLIPGNFYFRQGIGLLLMKRQIKPLSQQLDLIEKSSKNVEKFNILPAQMLHDAGHMFAM